MYIDFGRSSIEWETKTKSKGRFSIEATLETSDNFYCLGAKVMAGNVYNSKDLFKDPSYSFQPLLSGSDFSVFRLYNKDCKQVNTINENISTQFNYFKKSVMPLENFKEVMDFKKLIVEFNESKKLQVSLTNNDTVLQFPVKHINISESAQAFQVETGEILIQQGNNLAKAYIAFSSFDQADLLIETEVENKYYFII
jgi:hypothetical protein